MERAIVEARDRMRPPPAVIFRGVVGGVAPHPLDQDVTITHAGTAFAVVQAAADGPIATRFAATGPARPAGSA